MADISSSWLLTGPTTGDVYVGALDSHDVKLLLRSNSAAVYSPSGYVLFLRETTLMAQPFDLSTLSMRGEAVAVAEGVGSVLHDDRLRGLRQRDLDLPDCRGRANSARLGEPRGSDTGERRVSRCL